MAWRKANSLVGSIGRIRSAAASSPIAAAARSAVEPRDLADGADAEGVADHGGRPCRQLPGRGQRQQLRDQGRGHGRRELAGGRAARFAIVGGPLPLGLARQRIQVERVAAAGPVDGAAPRPAAAPAEHQLGLGLAQRAEPEAGRRVVTPGRGHRGPQPRGRLPPPVGQGEQHRPAGWLTEQLGDQLRGVLVGPLHVIQQQHECWRSQRLQQHPHRAEQAVPLAGGAGVLRAGTPERREDRGQHVAVGLRPPEVQPREVIVERVDQGVERDPFPAVLRPAVQHQEAAFGGPARQLRQ